MFRRSSLKLNGKNARQQMERGRIKLTSLSVADRQKLFRALKGNGSKFGNEYERRDGYTFDSKAEAERYDFLKLRQQAGEIEGLTVHQRFPLRVAGILIAHYEADFTYYDRRANRAIVEDVKGARTEVYRLKRALMKAI